MKAVLVLTPKHYTEYCISQCFATEFCQGSSGEGEEVRAAFGAVPAFTPQVCHAFFSSRFLRATPKFASPRDFKKWPLPSWTELCGRGSSGCSWVFSVCPLNLSLEVAACTVSHLALKLKCPVTFPLLNVQALCFFCACDRGSPWGRNLCGAGRNRSLFCSSFLSFLRKTSQNSGWSLSCWCWNPPGDSGWGAAQLPKGSRSPALPCQSLRARTLGSPKWWVRVTQPCRAESCAWWMWRAHAAEAMVLLQKCWANCLKGEAPLQQRLIQPQALHSREQLMETKDQACDCRPLIQLKYHDAWPH